MISPPSDQFWKVKSRWFLNERSASYAVGYIGWASLGLSARARCPQAAELQDAASRAGCPGAHHVETSPVGIGDVSTVGISRSMILSASGGFEGAVELVEGAELLAGAGQQRLHGRFGA